MSNFLAWAVLTAGLLVLAYTAWVVKVEGRRFAKQAQNFCLQNFTFSVPPWWSLVLKQDHRLLFERRDATYDWSAEFVLLSAPSSKSWPEVLQNQLHQQRIVLDEKNPISENHCGQLKFYQTEGSGTQDGEKRIWIESTIAVAPDQSCGLLCTSKSSILTGMVEGPGFEHVLKNLKVSVN